MRALGVRMIDGSGSFLKANGVCQHRGDPYVRCPDCRHCSLRPVVLPDITQGILSDKGISESGSAGRRLHDDLRAPPQMQRVVLMAVLHVCGRHRPELPGPAVGFQTATPGLQRSLHFKGEGTRKLTVNYIRQFYGAMRLFVQSNMPVVPFFA